MHGCKAQNVYDIFENVKLKFSSTVCDLDIHKFVETFIIYLVITDSKTGYFHMLRAAIFRTFIYEDNDINIIPYIIQKQLKCAIM